MTYILSSEDRRKLEEAMREISAMYAHAWDRADDGALFMMGPSVPRFEAAHAGIVAALSLLAGLAKVQDADGDALRLAVKSRFTIKDFAPHDNPEIVQAPPDAALWGMVEIWREDDNDPLHVEWYKAGADRCAITRRAIERAIAAMKEHPQ